MTELLGFVSLNLFLKLMQGTPGDQPVFALKRRVPGLIRPIVSVEKESLKVLIDVPSQGLF